MNCCDDYGNCNQARNCPVRQACELPVDQESATEWLLRWLVAGMAWIGVSSLVAMAAFMWGYKS